MNRLLRIAIAAAVCAVCMATAVGCLKGYDGNVVYVLKPLVSNGSENEDVDHYITAYAYYADTTHWTVASYDDAVAMRITNRESGDVRTEPAAVSEPFVEAAGNGHYSVEMTLRPRTMMIVAVDTEMKLYGYREQKLPEGLTSIFETVIFYPTRAAKQFKAGVWMMFNDFYVEPEPEPEPEQPDDPENPDDGGDGDDEENDGGDDPENPEQPDDPENPDDGDEEEDNNDVEGEDAGSDDDNSEQNTK